MLYKVYYSTVAILQDGTIGNLKQGGNTLFTNHPIEEIQGVINDFLKPKKLVAVIHSIERLSGHVIEKKA